MSLAPVVVNELTVIGSRCGPFGKALEGLQAHHFPVDRLISATYPLDRAPDALGAAGRPDAMKVLVRP
jgi:threonine dehydrogenase-like Zn-dependent dehydrogenase